MNRVDKRGGAPRRIGTCLKVTTLVAAALSSLWLGTANGQAGAETAVILNSTAPQARPMRLAANGPVQLTIAGEPANAAARDGGMPKGPNCTGNMRDHSEVTVPVGKSTMIQLSEPVRNRTLGNPGIAQAMLVSPQTLYVLGLDVGSTNMIVQGRSGSCSIVDLTVTADPGGLQSTLHRLIPGARDVKVEAAADSLVLSGSVSDGVQAQKVLDLANAFVMRPTRAASQGNAGMQGGMMQASLGGAGGMPGGLGGAAGAALRNPRIINMMSVASPQQVMIDVKVAEVSKTLVDQMNLSATFAGKFGAFGLIGNFLTSGTDGLGLFTPLQSFQSASSKTFTAASVAPLKGDGLVKILAEPNLMAISGQEASFLAGGKVFLPVPQSSSTGGTTITLQEESFGIGLRFTPTVLDNGRINLVVAPEVSELSPTGVSVTAPGASNATILPVINTRRASTTIQLMDGQSFAIGGLIKNNVTGSLQAIPGLGEVPVVGALMRSTSFQQDRTELLFVVTPHLVKPAQAEIPLPTDSFGPSTPGEVYFNGNMEGHPAPKPAPMPTPTPAALPAPGTPQTPQQPAAPLTSLPSATPPSVPAPQAASATPASLPVDPTLAAGASTAPDASPQMAAGGRN